MERGDILVSVGAVVLLIGTYGVGLVQGALRAQERVEDVQDHGEAIAEQLARREKPFSGLRLQDTKHGFTYKQLDDGGRQETCEGRYEVEGDRAKIVAGSLACTRAVDLTPGSYFVTVRPR
jgi:hypothetical protein